MSDYVKYNACRRHTCCPLSPEREFGIPVKRAALDKIRHSSWRGEEQKRDGTGCRYSLRLLVSDKAQWPNRCIPRTMMTSRRLVCRERSIVRGDEGRIMTRPSSRPEARSLLGYQTANELGAPVASSIPAQLPGHEPASARMGYEDGHALFLRY